MRAFTKPSQQLRDKVRPALLRSLHQTSLYRRLLLRAIAGGARTAAVGQALHSRISRNPKEGVDILKYLHGQYYTGKQAMRYGHAPTDACPLCGLPDSCTHIAGECPAHTIQIISKHNAACQLTHAAIRKAFKGGGALHPCHSIRLASADAGSKPQTNGTQLAGLTTQDISPVALPTPLHRPGSTLTHSPRRQGDTTATQMSRRTSITSSTET